MALDRMSPEEREVDRRIYGVDRDALAETGPSVVSLNGVVASLGVTEFMVRVSGLREPIRQLIYRGHMGTVTRSLDRPPEGCHYCGLWSDPDRLWSPLEHQRNRQRNRVDSSDLVRRMRQSPSDWHGSTSDTRAASVLRRRGESRVPPLRSVTPSRTGTIVSIGPPRGTPRPRSANSVPEPAVTPIRRRVWHAWRSGCRRVCARIRRATASPCVARRRRSSCTSLLRADGCGAALT